MLAWALLAVNVIAGIGFSPITAPRTARVQGAPQEEVEHVRSVLQGLAGMPSAQINSSLVAERLALAEGISGATVRANIFGRMAVSLESDQVLAALPGQQLVLTQSGRLRQLPHMEDAMKLHVPARSLAMGPAMVSAWEPSAAAEVCMAARKLAQPSEVHVDEEGAFTIRMEEGPDILLGTSYELQVKLKEMARRLEGKTDLAKIAELDFRSPQAPTGRER